MNVFMSIALISFMPLNIVIHELGHIAFYKLHGVRIRAVVFGIMILYNDRGRWGIVVRKPKREFCVYPQIEERYSTKYYMDVVLLGLLAGPFATCMLMLVWIIICVYTWSEVDAFIRMAILCNLLINVEILSSCFRETDDWSGDIIAYNRLRNNHNTLALYLLDYMMLSHTVCRGYEELIGLDPFEMDYYERMDYVFDIVALFLMGSIDRLDGTVEKRIMDILDSNIEQDIEAEMEYVFNQYRAKSVINRNVTDYDFKLNDGLTKDNLFFALNMHKLIKEAP